ncbi:MAG: hypothetical protein ACFB11_00835 [Paracoccaceae bacterium]
MMAAIETRLETQIPALQGRVGTGGELARIVDNNHTPQAPMSAYLIPLGLAPRDQGNAMAGAFDQMVDETIGVILVFRAADVGKTSKHVELQAAIMDVARALMGWSPDEENTVGVFRLAGGKLIRAQGGTIVYEIDFAISDQLRIFP